MTLIPSQEMLDLIAETMPASGDIAEFGVLRGGTTMRLAEIAKATQRKLWAVDSFEGMPEPGDEDADGDGVQSYPKGRFAGFTPEMLWNRLFPTNEASIPYECVKGWIPQCLDRLDGNRFAFVYVDLDHCDPTRKLLDWLVPRMVDGGIILCDDWFPGKDHLASVAIAEFYERADFDVIRTEYRQIAFRKVPTCQ
jgi:predicted O-methyltransferase YrrM